MLPAWKEILKELKMTEHVMPRDIVTRWNSTFEMLDYALEHRPAIDLVTQKWELGLRKLELSDDEWEVVEQLRNVLKVHACSALITDWWNISKLTISQILKDTTSFFSRSTLNLPMVITAMDFIDKEFGKYSCDASYLQSIHAAISLPKKTLNRYYSLTDKFEVYCIAMGAYTYSHSHLPWACYWH